MLLRPIKEAGTLLPKLVGVDKIIVGLLLAGSGAKVVWPLLKVVITLLIILNSPIFI